MIMLSSAWDSKRWCSRAIKGRHTNVVRAGYHGFKQAPSKRTGGRFVFDLIFIIYFVIYNERILGARLRAFQ